MKEMSTSSNLLPNKTWVQGLWHYWDYFLLITLAFLADRLSKWWAAAYLAEYGPTTFHPLFTLQESYNRGIALGLFQGIGPWVGWLTIAIVAGLFIYLVKLPPQDWLLRVGLSLIIGGALGNLVDRITIGQVLDFIQTPLRPGVFNIADIMIYLGVFTTLIGSFWPKEEG